MSAVASSSKPRRAWIGWIVRVLVSAAVLTVLFQKVPIGKVWADVQLIPPLLWLAALALFLVGHAASAAKWLFLIGPGVAYSQAFRAHLAGLAANLCLPGVAGGDVVRAGLVFASARDKSALAMGSLADRLLDTLGLLIISAVGMLLVAGPATGNARFVLPILVVFLIGLAVAFGAAIGLDRWLGARSSGGKVMRLLAKIAAAASALARRPDRLILCLTMSMAVQALFIGINIAFAGAVGVKSPAAAWFFAWSASKIIAIAPISLGGLGVREASMAGLMHPFGAAWDQVIAVGLIWQTVLYASGAIGAIVQALWRPGETRAGASILNPAITSEGTVSD